jgi:hypothetical protein
VESVDPMAVAGRQIHLNTACRLGANQARLPMVSRRSFKNAGPTGC